MRDLEPEAGEDGRPRAEGRGPNRRTGGSGELCFRLKRLTLPGRRCGLPQVFDTVPMVPEGARIAREGRATVLTLASTCVRLPWSNGSCSTS